jgi:hypothetical protein
MRSLTADQTERVSGSINRYFLGIGAFPSSILLPALNQ